MEIEFEDSHLSELESDPTVKSKWAREVITVFRRRIQFIRASQDERTFYAMKSLHFEKLKGNRSHERSMKLNQQWRLILKLEERNDRKVVVIVGIEDYH